MKQRPSRQPEDMKRLLSETGLASGPARDYSPERRLEESETRDTVRALVGTLSDNRRKVLELFLTGLDIEEICDSLKWEKARVRHLFYRGIDDLKQKTRPPAAGPDRPVPDGTNPGARS